mgnify:CR=1 FL=1
MAEVKQWLQDHPWLVGGGVVGLLLLAAAGYLGLRVVQAAPSQPIEFNHARHLEFGVQCEYCHVSAARADSAGLPTIAKCAGCHDQLTPRNAEMEKVKDYIDSGEPVAWVPVAIQPDFVQFSHHPHIAADLDCQECHGDMESMTVAEPQAGQNMGWCLTCHQSLAPQRFEVLSDCSACHY